MSAEKYMERAFATIAASFSASAPELRIVAEKVATLCAEIEAETREAILRDVLARKGTEQIMRDDNRRAKDRDMAEAHGDRAQMCEEIATAIRGGTP